MGNTTRRSPPPDERKLNPDRSCRLLLEAALDEFAEKGFAGARVQSIADRAGVNKQLISYYFGGKKGLYEELHRRWQEEEAELHAAASSAEDIAVRHLRRTLADPRGARLLLWAGLTGDALPPGHEDCGEIERLQAAGEIGADLDPRVLLMVMMSAVSAPVLMPDLARKLFGLEPDDPGFADLYAEQLRRIVRRLGPEPDPEPDPEPGPEPGPEP